MAVVETVETLKAKLEFFQTQLADQFTNQEKKIDEGIASLTMLINTGTDSMNMKVEESLINHKVQIEKDAANAKAEFDQVKVDHQTFYDNSEKKFTDMHQNYVKFYADASSGFLALKARVDHMETNGPSGNTPEKKDGSGHGYIPTKSMMPKKFHRRN